MRPLGKAQRRIKCAFFTLVLLGSQFFRWRKDSWLDLRSAARAFFLMADILSFGWFAECLDEYLSGA